MTMFEYVQLLVFGNKSIPWLLFFCCISMEWCCWVPLFRSLRNDIWLFEVVVHGLLMLYWTLKGNWMKLGATVTDVGTNGMLMTQSKQVRTWASGRLTKCRRSLISYSLKYSFANKKISDQVSFYPIGLGFRPIQPQSWIQSHSTVLSYYYTLQVERWYVQQYFFFAWD